MTALVTGGGGFLGRAIVEALLARGEEVRSLGRGAHLELAELGARPIACDLADADGVARAVRGVDVVYHVAALTGVWGPRADFYRANVEGTRNVLAACRAAGVTRLVHTSSPSVCFDGRDHVRAGNDLPHAERFLSPYPETKAVAEREVLAAGGPELAVCVLRPHLVFGPRDPHLVPRLVARARAGRLRVVGDGRNEVSLTWIDNAARAHLAAADRLAPDAPHAGRAYFVTQRDPVRLWDWIRELLERLGEPPPGRAISRRGAERLGAVLEAVWRALRLSGEPPMTRFVAGQLATSHSYDLGPAERDFGYREEVSMERATELLIESLRGAPARTAAARAAAKA